MLIEQLEHSSDGGFSNLSISKIQVVREEIIKRTNHSDLYFLRLRDSVQFFGKNR